MQLLKKENRGEGKREGRFCRFSVIERGQKKGKGERKCGGRGVR